MSEKNPIKHLNTVFFGGEPLSVPTLEVMKTHGVLPALVVCNPDRPQGRKQELTPPPTKVWALEHDIPVLQPENLKDDPELDLLKNSEWDLFIVVAYSKIIPKEILDLPARGTVNVHPSLLPKLRGASPIRSAILEDMRETGVTVMLMDEKMDHGPVLAQASIALEESDWPPKGCMFDALMAEAGAELLLETLPDWIAGNITPEPQDHEKATFCGKITKDMGELDLSADPYQNYLKICAFDGWPGTFFFAEKDDKKIRIKITDAQLSENGELDILRVIPEGKKEMDYSVFIKK